MSALDELKKKTYDQMDDVEKALIVLWGDVDWYEDVAAKGMDVYAALRERVAELESSNRWWLENYDITMPCGHKNRYLDVNAKGEIVRDENGDAVCTLCIVESK